MQITRSRVAAVAGGAAILLIVVGQSSPTEAAPSPDVGLGPQIGIIKQITGTKQGPFTNNGSPSVGLLALRYGIVVPRDAATGQATGKRQHQPLIITKALDNMSPQILDAAANNEVLKDVVVDVTINGKVPVAEYKLQNASIAEVKDFTPSSGGGPAEEEVSLVFQKITVTVGNKVFTDTVVPPG